MEKTVCFTGHRQIADTEYAPLMDALRKEIEKQIQNGAVHFRTGGALGFDTVAALSVLSLRREYPNIRLELILPCPTQTKDWTFSDARLYEQILAQADLVRYVSPFYRNGVLQMRNRALVDGANVCIAFLKHSHGGGTAYTAAYALKNGLELINLAEQLPHT